MGGTAMPAFKDRLSETERWDVVNFLKTFTPAERRCPNTSCGQDPQGSAAKTMSGHESH
jgi:hypothetical protein